MSGYVFRLLSLLLVAAVCSVALPRSAFAYVPTETYGTHFYYQSGGPYFASDTLACAAVPASVAYATRGVGGSDFYGYWINTALNGSGYCRAHFTNGSETDIGLGAYTGNAPSCPNGGSLSGGACVCPSGETDTGTACTAVNCATVAQGISGVLYAASGGAGVTACYQGCRITGAFSGTDPSGTYVAGPFTGSSAPCEGSPSAAPSALPPGKCPGTVNGTAVVVDCATTTTPGPSTTASGPGTGASGAGTGSSTTSTTVCTGNSCTTTVNTYAGGGGAGGSPTGTGTKTQDKGSFCAENPGLQMCKEGAISGSCAAVSCSGDAIQCAMAREQAKRNCELMDTATPLSTVGTAAATGTDPADHPKNSVQESAVALSSMLSSVPLFGTSGQCPQDVPFSHAGFSFALPFSTLCPYLQLLGSAFLAACYLGAGLIVFRRG